MKNRIIFIVSLIVLFLCISFVPTKAESITTSSEITVIGAQVRTTGNAGIRFVGEVGNLDKSNISKYGIILAYGETEVSNDFILGGTINDKVVLGAEVTSLTAQGQFFITLYNIPESAYSQAVTARAYVITNNDEVIYSDSATDRSLEDVVVLAYMDNDRSEFVSKVFDKIQEKNLNDFVFEINGENATITDYTGSAKHLVIPSIVTIEEVEYTVDAIGDMAFEYCTSLISVEIPSSVKSIGYGSFYNCTSLINIIISNGVISIDVGAFDTCTSLMSITIPSSVTNIEISAFARCSSLENIVIDENNEVYDSRNNCNAIIETSTNTLITGCKNTVIPSSVTVIGIQSFLGCSDLKNITIPNSVTNIGRAAFAYCTSLESISIPNGVSTIDFNTFDNCASLVDIKLPSSITSIKDYAFNGCRSLSKITIPDNVSTIGGYVFANCTSLTNITIPSNVSNISLCVFQGCTSLTSVSILSNLISIGDYAFEECTLLNDIILPSSLRSIGKYSFSNCSSLASVIIPSKVNIIKEYAFNGCSSLTIYCEALSKPNGYYDNWNCSNCPIIWGHNHSHQYEAELIEPTCTKDGYTIYTCECGDSYNSDEVPALGHSFGDWTITTQPTELENGLEQRLCANCSETIDNEITLSDTYLVYTLINDEYYDVTGYNSDTFGGGAIEISATFRGLPVKNIGDNAFSNCTKLTSITFPNSIISIGNYAFRYCTKLTTIEIPANVQSIGNYSFADCSLLKTVTITYGLESIGERAFYNCQVLTNINIPNSVISIGGYAFRSCKTLKNIEIPNSVTHIGNSTFEGCDALTNVTIPNSVTNIGSSAFNKCSDLSSIYYNGTIEDWCNITFESYYSNPMVYSLHLFVWDNNKEYYDVKSLNAITLPNGMTTIKAYTLVDCTDLESIVIPISVTIIESSAIYNCSSLKIYCEATSKPIGWDSLWNYDDCPVQWGY